MLFLILVNSVASEILFGDEIDYMSLNWTNKILADERVIYPEMALSFEETAL